MSEEQSILFWISAASILFGIWQASFAAGGFFFCLVVVVLIVGAMIVEEVKKK